MSTPQRFKNKEYINWVKCSLSLIVMKEGLQVYVDTEVRNLHSHLEHKVALPTGRCSSCTWKDVRRTKRNPLTWYITCGSNVCNRWLSEILSVHTDPHSHSINWKNADINQWPTNPYEIAKVYMPKGQDRIHNLPKEFDAPAVLSLLKYCTWFSKNIPNVQLLSDLIDVRNEVLHSGELKVIDSNKDIWIDKMIQLLSDLNINGSAQSELNRIKREDIEINFRDYEIKALQNLVSGLFSKLAEVTGEMASLQNVQTQQSEETTKHAEEVQELKEIYDKIETFLINNSDINDIEITKNMTDFKKDIQEELSQIKVKVLSLDDGLETLNDRLEKHIEETQLQFKGVGRQLDALENKSGNNIQPIHQKENDDASTSRNRSSNAKTNSISQMKSSKRPVNTISRLSKGSTNWRLCVRVISKSNIFRKRKMDEGYYRIIEYFSVFFRDKSGEIRGVFFKDSVKNFKQLYKLLKVKKVFYVSGASVTETNPLYHRAHLELKMNNKTSIEPCRVAVDIPIIGEYHFTKINMLRYTQKDEFVDIIGVVDSIGEIETISTEYYREQTKRELVLVDQSRMVVSVTFWGRHARAFGLRQKQIIVLIGVKVSDWKGLSLSRQASTQMHIEPDIQETRSLRKWYDDIGNGKDFTWVFR